MQRLYYVAPGADRAVEADSADLAGLRAAGGWIWLDVVGVVPAEVQAIADQFGFDHLAVEDVLDESEYPKVDDYPDHTMAVLLGIADDEQRLRMVEYDAFLGPGYLVTFLHEDLPGFGWMRSHLTEPGRLGGGGPDRFLALLVEAEAARFRTVVDSLEQQIDSLEDRALAGDAAVIGEIHALRRDGLLLRRVAGPLEDATHRLAREDLSGLGQRARMRFASIEDGFERIIETLDASRGLLGAVLETYRASVAEKANEVMKVLTVFAAIVLPLSLMAGIYGMNFRHMPELAWRWSYFGLLGAMALVGVGLWFYFSRRGFIGGPRFGEVPKTIGRGLSGVVRLTTKPVAGLARAVRGRADGSDGDQPD
ncbi:MAG: magnesium transporter CorA family protein [Actinomycetota bacterium]